MFRQLLILILSAATLLADDRVSLDRIVVIGASVSRGFTKSEPFGGEKSTTLRFDRYLDAALTAPHGKIINDSNHLFFSSVEEQAQTQLNRLNHRKPTLVVAVDFLFWFLYGEPDRVGNRLQSFDRGLAMLERIDAPLVIGDIPDTSAAIGRMLSRRMVPDAKTLEEANRRLAAWAAGKPGVSILSLSSFVKSVESDTKLQAGPLTIASGRTWSLLQDDRLHPTPVGNAMLALATLATLLDNGLEKEAVLWDPESVAGEVIPGGA
jgi:hypothetical protein